MKKFLGILVLGLSLMLLNSCAMEMKYKDYPKKTEYYNFLEKTGPDSVDAAILLLSKKTNLDMIEGIWISPENFTIAITQEDRNYSIYRVEDPEQKKLGYKDGTIIKGASDTQFNAREAAAKDDRIYCVANVEYLLIGFYQLQLTISDLCGRGGHVILYKRIWPENEKEAKKEKTTTKKAETKVETASGSAFFVSDTGYIITNFHVIETCNDNSKIFYKNNEIDAKLIAKDEYLDLALLQAEVNNNKFITISNKAPRKLQRIIAAGYPFGKYLSDDMKFTSGIVSSLKGIKDDSTRLQIDAALNPGNSGGPIVDENTGELVAVAVAGLRKDMTEAVNYGIKAGSVKNFLESNQIDSSIFSKKFSTENIAEHLESTVLYTFCE